LGTLRDGRVLASGAGRDDGDRWDCTPERGCIHETFLYDGNTWSKTPGPIIMEALGAGLAIRCGENCDRVLAVGQVRNQPTPADVVTQSPPMAALFTP